MESVFFKDDPVYGAAGKEGITFGAELPDDCVFGWDYPVFLFTVHPDGTFCKEWSFAVHVQTWAGVVLWQSVFHERKLVGKMLAIPPSLVGFELVRKMMFG